MSIAIPAPPSRVPGGEPVDWMAFRVSMHAALLATLIVTAIGIPVGYALAKTRFRGAPVIEGVLTLPMALPPTVMGYYLLTQMGGDTVFRDLSMTWFGHPLTFTFAGIVIAQAVEAFPFCVRATRAAVAGVDAKMESAARSIGIPEWRVALQVTLPLARRGILVGVALGFGRALGDYAATDMVSGHVPGATTMSMTLFGVVVEHKQGDANALALTQLAIAVAIMVGASLLGNGQMPSRARWARRPQPGSEAGRRQPRQAATSNTDVTR